MLNINGVMFVGKRVETDIILISGWWPSYVLNTVSIGRSYFFPCSIPFHSIQTVIDDSTPAECESEKNVIKYIETGESWCETFAKSWPTSQHKSDWIRVGSKPSSNKIWDEPNLPLCCQDQMGRKLFRWFIYVWFLVVLRLSLCGGLGWWFGGSGKFLSFDIFILEFMMFLSCLLGHWIILFGVLIHPKLISLIYIGLTDVS